jgi:peptidoglycan L-alanyl-D-glutamate endopeptidase CwlK
MSALINSLDLLDPVALPFFESFINKLEKAGLTYSVLETLRKVEVQRAYYAQGRQPLEEINELRKIAGLPPLKEKDSKYEITWTMKSYHLVGRAADIVPFLNGKIAKRITKNNAGIWLEFGRLGQEAGLGWGGNWKPLDKYGIGIDAPHYQYTVE